MAPVFRCLTVTLVAYGRCGAEDSGGARQCRGRVPAGLESSVEFERRIRDRWREKCREKNQCIAELEERVADLERRLEEKEDL